MTSHEDDYLLFKNRLSVKILLMMACSILIISVVYLFVLKDNFANVVVAILDRFIYHDRDEAMAVYLRTFKAYEIWLFLMAVMGVFFVIFRRYLDSISKYFKEINRGLIPWCMKIPMISPCLRNWLRPKGKSIPYGIP